MGQNVSKRYATDDPELTKFLKEVMGNKKAARLFWSCLLEDSCEPISFLEGFERNAVVEDSIECEELGIVLPGDLTHELDVYCIGLGISRFSAILSAYAVLVERFTDGTSFWISHNYGVTGTAHRILRNPVTRVHLRHEDASISFRDLCSYQDELIQKSSYHLCIPQLPEESAVERCLGVFLLDDHTGHTRDTFVEAVKDCTLPLVIEIGGEGEITLRLNYDPRIHSAEFAAMFFSQLVFTLKQCLRSPNLDDVRAVPTVPPEQTEELIDQSVFKLPYDNNVDFPDLYRSLEYLIKRQAHQTPNRIAVRQHSPIFTELTYCDLLEKANLVKCRILSQFPVEANSRIGVLLNRGMSQVIAVLGILLAGCVYVPLDPLNHPPERIDYILRDSGAVGLITESSVPVARSFHSKFPCIDINSADDVIEEETECNPPTSERVREAYVIYTSGSTGNPKGVVVPQKGIVNDIFCLFKQFLNSDLSIIENVLFSTNLCFDAHVDELFLPIVFGGTITCLDSNIALSPLDPDWGLSFVQSTPSVFQVIQVPDSVRCVLIGGEALSKSTIEKVMKPDGGRIVINGYGPTETTNESSLHIVNDSNDFRSIGKPIWNTQFYVMDKSGRSFVPKHAWGELYIGGVGVTKGYCNLPEMTAKVFTTLPSGQSVYKTGDIVRINLNGDIEFKGRSASCSQIKLRGYRIELGEIQYSILSNNPDILEAHVCVAQVGGDSLQVIAYIAPNIPKDGLKYGQLSEYMKPTLIIPLKSFPRNISGKLDLKALPKPTSTAGGSLSPITENGSAKVASAFRQCLGLESERLDETTNFFSIGGNSLNVIQLKSKLVEIFDVPSDAIKLQLLFQLQTVGAIARYLEGDQVDEFIDTVLVPIGPKRINMPRLFCIHAAGGQIHTYSALAAGLAGGVDFYGIQDPSLSHGPTHRLNSFESMGAFYAKRINDFLSGGDEEGNVFLAGHSSGGSIAFETARSLQDDFGRKIGCVFLIDTECTIAGSRNETSLVERLDEIRYYLYSGWKEGLVEDYINAMTTVSESNGGKAWQLLKAILPSRRSSSMRWSTDLLDMISLLSHHLQIEKRYSPFRSSSVCDFPLVLFRPADESNLQSQWGRATRGKVFTVDIPNANHYTLVREPAVSIIATVIRDIIEKTQTTEVTVRE